MSLNHSLWTTRDLLHKRLSRIAIWERRMAIIIPLGIFCLAHWGLLYHGIIIVRANWDGTQGACIVDETNPTFLRINFFFSMTFPFLPSSSLIYFSFLVVAMAFDLVIFVFTATALFRNSNRSGLWTLLFRDGLVYWGITFCVNAIPAVSRLLRLSV